MLVGNNSSFNHTSLDPATHYYYKIWSVSSANEYSPSQSAKAATFCDDQVLPIEEGFNGAEVSACWTIELVTEGNAEEEAASITQIESGRYPEATPVEGTHMIQFNSTYCGDGNIMRLSSPQFSTVDLTDVVVSFSWHQDDTWPEYLDFMTLQWSTDGSTWTDGESYQRYNATTQWTNQSYTLPPEAEGLANVQVAFLFTSKYGYNCYLDELRIGLDNTTALANIEQSQLIIYPNPSAGLIQLKPNSTYKKIGIKVRDLNGKLIYFEQPKKNDFYTIDLSNQAKGIYLLELVLDDKRVNQKIILK